MRQIILTSSSSGQRLETRSGLDDRLAGQSRVHRQVDVPINHQQFTILVDLCPSLTFGRLPPRPAARSLHPLPLPLPTLSH
eukprot:6787043-Prymnesium_polylepis.1